MSEETKDPRVFLAAERTFLAWIRTGLALMSFGFVLARFGIFLRSLALTSKMTEVKSSHFSVSVGMALIVVGVVVQVLALLHYRRLLGELNSGQVRFDKPSTLATFVALTLAAVGLGMSIYLLVIQ